MKNYLFVFFVFVFIYSCEKKDIDIEKQGNSDLFNYLSQEIKEDVKFNGRYLEIKSMDVFDSLFKLTNTMDSVEFANWENELGFTSARSIMVEYKMLHDGGEEVLDLETRYAEKLRFLENDIVRYKFYCSGYDKLLNTEGEIMIGGIFYKYTDNTEYISLDGKESRIPDDNLKSGMVDDSLLISISNCGKLKSTSTLIIEEGIKTVTLSDDITRRLIWSLEHTCWVTPVGFNAWNGTYTWRVGYSLQLVMQQQKYQKLCWLCSSWGWKDNDAWYWVKDMDIKWGQTGLIPDDGTYVGYDGTYEDQFYEYPSGKITHHLVYIQETYSGGYARPTGLDFALDRLHLKFYSSGIEESNAITIDR